MTVDLMQIVKHYIKQHFGDIEYSVSPYSQILTEDNILLLPTRGNIYTLYFLIDVNKGDGTTCTFAIESDTHSSPIRFDGSYYDFISNSLPYQGRTFIITKQVPVGLNLNFLRVEVKN